MPPEELSRRLDMLLGRSISRYIKSGEDAPGELIATTERRLKALGETKKPEPKDKPTPAGSDRIAEFVAELAKEEQAKRATPPAESLAGPASAHPTEGTASPSASGSP